MMEWRRLTSGIRFVCQAADSDNDAFRDGDEFVAGTSPTNPASFFELLEPYVQHDKMILQWETAEGRNYSVLSCSNLEAACWVYLPGYTNLPGTGALLTITNDMENMSGSFLSSGSGKE